MGCNIEYSAQPANCTVCQLLKFERVFVFMENVLAEVLINS